MNFDILTQNILNNLIEASKIKMKNKKEVKDIGCPICGNNSRGEVMEGMFCPNCGWIDGETRTS